VAPRKTARKSSETMAVEAWRLMLDFLRAHHTPAVASIEFGLNPGAAKMLLDLEPDDPRPMRALAETFACDASNITWMVDRLEERGLVERHTLPTDRRVKTIALTPLGEKTKAELLERFYEPPADLVALPAEALESLLDALRSLPTQA
jgi:DNA-binding MarR family transcriptional regulator